MTGMIGFDRPLRPEWIHQCLHIWRPNTPLREFHRPFDKVVESVQGKEGRRKTRTVLFRYFFDFTGTSSNQRTTGYSLLAELSHRADLTTLKPLYITVLVVRSSNIAKTLDLIMRLYPSDFVDARHLVQKSLGLFGHRDVVRRSTRSFLRTLANFGILRPERKDYIWNGKLNCSSEQLAYLIGIYSILTEAVELDLERIHADVRLGLVDLSNIEDCARKYNGILWSYVRRPSTSKLHMVPNLAEKILTISDPRVSQPSSETSRSFQIRPAVL